MFSTSVQVKKSGSFAKLGASDYFQAKTGKRIQLSSSFRKKSRNRGLSQSAAIGASVQRTFSVLQVQKLTMDASEQEIIVHMKLPGSGILLDKRTKNGIRENFFTSKQLIDWLSKEFGEFNQFKILEIAQKLITGEFIIPLDKDENEALQKNWINPQFRLKFCEGNDFVHLPNDGFTSYSYSEFSECDNSDEGSFNSNNDDSAIFTEAIDMDNIDFKVLVSKMKHPQSGVKIKNRKWLLKKFPNCFVGEQAVTWFCHYLDVDREGAVKIGLQLQEQNLLRHVTNDHPFQDKYLFFTFDMK